MILIDKSKSQIFLRAPVTPATPLPHNTTPKRSKFNNFDQQFIKISAI